MPAAVPIVTVGVLDEINDGYRSLVKGAVARSVVVFPDVT